MMMKSKPTMAFDSKPEMAMAEGDGETPEMAENEPAESSEGPETATVSLDMLGGAAKPGKSVTFTVVSVSPEDGTATIKACCGSDMGGIKRAAKAFDSESEGSMA